MVCRTEAWKPAGKRKTTVGNSTRFLQTVPSWISPRNTKFPSPFTESFEEMTQASNRSSKSQRRHFLKKNLEALPPQHSRRILNNFDGLGRSWLERSPLWRISKITTIAMTLVVPSSNVRSASIGGWRRVASVVARRFLRSFRDVRQTVKLSRYAVRIDI